MIIITALDVGLGRAQSQQLSDNPPHEPTALARPACHGHVRSSAGYGAGRGDGG